MTNLGNGSTDHGHDPVNGKSPFTDPAPAVPGPRQEAPAPAGDATRCIGWVRETKSRCVEPRVEGHLTCEAHMVNAKRLEAEAEDRKAAKSNGKTWDKPEDGPRAIKLTKASTIKPKAVHWLWAGEQPYQGRIPAGMMTLIGGREGTGKSTVAYTIGAKLTRGTLPGAHFGTPKCIIAAAYEDSWEHTIAPRLIGARADLDRVFRVDVETLEGRMGLSLPKDIAGLEAAITENDVVMVIMDPMMSALDARMKSNEYQSVYQALLPIAGIADRTKCAFVGITHLNKTTGVDPMSRIMGSTAFAGVVRSALIVHQVRPDEEVALVSDPMEPLQAPEGVQLYLLGHEKNNVGPKLSTLVYSIKNHFVETDDGETVPAPAVVWHGETEETVSARMASESAPAAPRPTKEGTAREWLLTYLADSWHEKPRVVEAAAEAGHMGRTLERAATELGKKGNLRRFQRVPGPVMWTTSAHLPEPQ